MPRFLTDAERARLATFPEQATEEDLVAYFTLSPDDLAVIRRRRGDANRLGFALQLCTLRFLGFVPEDVTAAAPDPLVAYLSAQLGVSPAVLVDYAERAQTRTDHLAEAITTLGFRIPGLDDLARLGEWLLDRALEHDKPTLLFQLAAEHLRVAKLVRPGVTVIERLVITSREQAEKETYRRLAPLITEERAAQFDALLVPDPTIGPSRFAWLRKGATSAKPRAILAELDKLTFVRALGAAGWDLSTLNPNRLKFLAQLARRSPAQALQRAAVERRMTALIAFLAESVWQFTDEVVELFDRTLFAYHSKAMGDLDDLKRANARAANEKVVIFSRVAQVLLDDAVADLDVRAAIWRELPRDKLALALTEAIELARPLDDNYFDFLATRYSHVRSFAPSLLAGLDLRANAAGVELLHGVELLRQLNTEGRRRVPDDAPLAFVPPRWRPYVLDGEGGISRQYWELCLLSELRDALRSGDVWVASSRRYANPETFLISPERWPSMRVEACAMLGAATTGAERLATCATEVERRLARLDRALAAGAAVRVEDGELVITPLSAEELPEDVTRVQTLVADRLPKVELADLLIEVDRWCGFTEHLTHAGGATSRTRDLGTHLYAAVLAQACNFGVSNMAEMADLSARQLAWTREWYLREETLKAATTAVVNYQHRLPLASVWGGGTLSSSDGQRFPVGVKSITARSIPRYFGFGRGLTFYTWTSDQFSQFGTKVVSSTVRDATYVLDGLLDNETELDILEHTTDTAGYTDLVFALFDLLGLQFAPRIRDLGDHRLYRLAPLDGYLHFGPFMKGTINRQIIVERWDDLLRVAASLKLGWVTSSLLISRLQASPRQNALTKALQEYGRVVKTLFVLRYLESEEYRRRINLQLNKGESLHALRSFLFFAEEGRIRRRHLDEQTNQANSLNLVTNAVITWNTVYIAEVLRQLRAEGHNFGPEAIIHLSPAMYAHVNRYGKYTFNVEPMQPGQLRPLREPAPASP